MKCVHCFTPANVIEFCAMPGAGNAVLCRSGKPKCPGFMTADEIEQWAAVFRGAPCRKANLAIAAWLRSAPVALVVSSARRGHKSRAAWLAKREATKRLEERRAKFRLVRASRRLKTATI